MCIIEVVRTMNLILSMVMQEKQRIEYMLAKYTEEYQHLPKGSISEKKNGEKTYFYLKYRDGKKVVSRYVSKADVDKLRSQIKKRKHIEAMIKSLQNELSIADRILEAEL